MLRKVPFIKPMAPTLAIIPPAGPNWLHEVKFDGWRMQLHVDDGAATLYSKNGTDYTNRFRSLRPALARVPGRSAIIDCELVACDETGMPSFRTLMELGNKSPALCLWCFDLLHLSKAGSRPAALHRRRDTVSRHAVRWSKRGTRPFSCTAQECRTARAWRSPRWGLGPGLRRVRPDIPPPSGGRGQWP